MARRGTKDEEADLVERNILLVADELDKMYDTLKKSNWNEIKEDGLRKVAHDRHLELLKKFQDLNKDFMDQVGIMDIYRRNETSQRKMRANFNDCPFHELARKLDRSRR